MNILDTKIQYFPGKVYKCKPLGEITLKQFIESHKNPKQNIKDVFKQIQEAEVKEDWETKGKLKQENLFYFTPCVKLDGLGRSYSNIQEFNSLVVWDFDHIGMDAGEFRDKLFEKYKSIVCAYKSPSGNGVKALVRIPKVHSIEEFKGYFYGMAFTMENVKSFDTTGQNCCLPLFLSWDEGIRWREDAEEWTQRGGKHNEFEARDGDFEELEDVTDEDKKEVLRRCYNIIKKADEEQCGHPNILSVSTLIGGFIPSGYLTYDEAEGYLFKWIDESPYLSTKADIYKKTAVTMINKGMSAPLYLRRHQDKEQQETYKKDSNKNKRKYFLYCDTIEYPTVK